LGKSIGTISHWCLVLGAEKPGASAPPARPRPVPWGPGERAGSPHSANTGIPNEWGDKNYIWGGERAVSTTCCQRRSHRSGKLQARRYEEDRQDARLTNRGVVLRNRARMRAERGRAAWAQWLPTGH